MLRFCCCFSLLCLGVPLGKVVDNRFIFGIWSSVQFILLGDNSRTVVLRTSS